MVFHIEIDILLNYVFRTLPSKEPVSAPAKKPRWKLKASKDSKTKKQLDDSLLKLKKKLSYDKKDDADGTIMANSEPTTSQQLPRIILRSDLGRDISQDTHGNDNQNLSKVGTNPVPISASFNPGQSRDVHKQDLLTGSLDYFKDDVHKPFIILSQV